MAPNRLALGANGAGIHKSHQNIANKEAANRHVSTPLGYPHQAQQREQPELPPVFLWKGFVESLFHQLLPEGLAVN